MKNFNFFLLSHKAQIKDTNLGRPEREVHPLTGNEIYELQTAINNLAHTFMSIDYMKSGRLAVNVLIDLNNLRHEPNATYNLIEKIILPIDARTKESRELLNDYLCWLAFHFAEYNCDLTKLEKLEILIWTAFDKALTPQGMSHTKEFTAITLTKCKADGRDKETSEIFKAEVIKENIIKLRIPEFK